MSVKLYDYSFWPTEHIIEDLKKCREIQPKQKLADMMIRVTKMIIAAEEELQKRGIEA